MTPTGRKPLEPEMQNLPGSGSDFVEKLARRFGFRNRRICIEKPGRYLCWYIEPRYPNRKVYLCRPENWPRYYSPNRSDASLFETREDAEALVPVYDGSPNISERTGVELA